MGHSPRIPSDVRNTRLKKVQNFFLTSAFFTLHDHAGSCLLYISRCFLVIESLDNKTLENLPTGHNSDSNCEHKRAVLKNPRLKN